MTNFEKVREFMLRMEQQVSFPMSIPLIEFREKLLQEEFEELGYEIENALWDINDGDRVSRETKERMLKEMVDVLYVVYGMGVAFGLPVDEAFNRVHLSNMSKLVDGKPVKNGYGKVMKGKNYKAAVLEDLVV